MDPPTAITLPYQEDTNIDATTRAIIDGWLDESIDSATAIKDPEHPFFVHSTNANGFKYKYPEAAPTPPGEDDAVWNKTYTAADSRMYNKNGKDHNNSRKFRASKQTYELCLQVHKENKTKHAKKFANPLDMNTILAVKASKPKAASTKPNNTIKTESASHQDDFMDGDAMSSMSISEKIKSKEGKRKASASAALAMASSPAPSSPFQFAAGPSASPSVAGPSSTPSLAVQPPGSDPPNLDKAAKPKKKGTATSSKKPKAKKAAPAPGSSNVSHGVQPAAPRASTADDSGSDSDDDRQYCICRGRDDHRMMVFCDGDCKEWYHCECIKIDEKDAEELLDIFYCNKCTIPGVKFTTWKRMCRYYNVDNTHRIAARVNDGSKYCSEECNEKFWLFVQSKLRKDNAPSIGGALNQEEFATLLHSAGNAAAFHALGEKPTLPKEEGRDESRPVGLDHVTAEEQAELNELKTQKAELQMRIESYHNQLKLLTMVQERARIAARHHPSLETTAICGYDNRLSFNEYEFRRWMESDEAKKAFDTGKLGPRTAANKSISAIVPFPGQVIAPPTIVPDLLNNICVKKAKSCKHQKWFINHKDTFSFEITLLREDLDTLKAREDFIIQDAETREAMKAYHAHNVTIQLF